MHLRPARGMRQSPVCCNMQYSLSTDFRVITLQEAIEQDVLIVKAFVSCTQTVDGSPSLSTQPVLLMVPAALSLEHQYQDYLRPVSVRCGCVHGWTIRLAQCACAIDRVVEELASYSVSQYFAAFHD